MKAEVWENSRAAGEASRQHLTLVIAAFFAACCALSSMMCAMVLPFETVAWVRFIALELVSVLGVIFSNLLCLRLQDNITDYFAVAALVIGMVFAANAGVVIASALSVPESAFAISIFFVMCMLAFGVTVIRMIVKPQHWSASLHFP